VACVGRVLLGMTVVRAADGGAGLIWGPAGFLEADAPRVNCPTRGPTVRQVPWARHGGGHTREFDSQVA